MKEVENSLQDYTDEDELDLVALVSANANDTSQYLIFEGSDGQFYAQNVSKIEELLVYKDVEIARNHTDDLIVGTADIRGNMTTIVKFDQWFGNEVLDDSEYELIILTYYGEHHLGIVVKRVEYIVNIPPETMVDNSQNNDKTTFVTRVKIGKESKLCLIYDSDKLMLDVFDSINLKANNEIEIIKKIDSNKFVLFADDSKFIRLIVEELFNKMGINYKLYENGQQLLDDLQKLETDEISLIITDLEMPVVGGRSLVEHIRENKKYDEIDIIVHTNMLNTTMSNHLKELGVQEIVEKINLHLLQESIEKRMRR